MLRWGHQDMLCRSTVWLCSEILELDKGGSPGLDLAVLSCGSSKGELAYL